MSDRILLKELEVVYAAEVCELHMDSVILFLQPHPVLLKLLQSFLCLIKRQLLHELVSTKHVPSDIPISI